jgi:hypothetical protein
MTTLALLTARREELKAQRNDIFEQIKPLQDQASSIGQEIASLNESITIETLKMDMTEQERFDFLMHESGSGTDKIRYAASQKFIESFGLYGMGYRAFSQQRSVDVFIYKLDLERNAKSIAGLKHLIPLFKPMDKDGNKIINIFTQEHYIYALPDGKFSLRSNYPDKDFDSLEELFTYYIRNYECYDDEVSDD